jgi:two-component system, NarL family, nitrate/nitrite response regulator NarL
MPSFHAYQEQELAAGAAGTHVTRVHIYADPLIRAGLEEILDGTRFIVNDAAPESVSQLSPYGNPVSELFVVDEKYSPNAIAELIGELKARHSAARVIVLANQFDFNAFTSTLQAGADGFCLTSSSRDVLIHSIELVMLGEAVVPSELILAITREGAHCFGGRRGPGLEKLTSSSPQKPLSSREIEVLRCLKEGAPNKVIARNLNLAEATVKVHIKKILRKIGAINRAQAAIWAANHLPVDTSLQ